MSLFCFVPFQPLASCRAFDFRVKWHKKIRKLHRLKDLSPVLPAVCLNGERDLKTPDPDVVFTRGRIRKYHLTLLAEICACHQWLQPQVLQLLVELFVLAGVG